MSTMRFIEESPTLTDFGHTWGEHDGQIGTAGHRLRYVYKDGTPVAEYGLGVWARCEYCDEQATEMNDEREV